MSLSRIPLRNEIGKLKDVEEDEKVTTHNDTEDKILLIEINVLIVTR